jgi:hypothetical protein
MSDVEEKNIDLFVSPPSEIIWMHKVCWMQNKTSSLDEKFLGYSILGCRRKHPFSLHEKLFFLGCFMLVVEENIQNGLANGPYNNTLIVALISVVYILYVQCMK